MRRARFSFDSAGDLRDSMAKGVPRKETLFDMMPGLASHVEGPTDPHYVVIRMKPKRIRLAGRTMTYKEVPVR